MVERARPVISETASNPPHPAARTEAGPAIMDERAVGEIDEKQEVDGAQVAALIVVFRRLEEHHVSLGLVIGVEPERALHADEGKAIGRGAREEPVKPVGLSRVHAADGLSKISPNQLDAVVF